LVEYLAEYHKDGVQFVFTALVSGRQYSGWSLRKMVKVVAKRAKIIKRVYPHLMRHSFACNLLIRGANIMSIKELMGHSDIRTTLIYTHSVPQRVQQEYNFYCPNYV
jgi:site-specific recombinase XerD